MNEQGSSGEFGTHTEQTELLPDNFWHRIEVTDGVIYLPNGRDGKAVMEILEGDVSRGIEAGSGAEARTFRTGEDHELLVKSFDVGSIDDNNPPFGLDDLRVCVALHDGLAAGVGEAYLDKGVVFSAPLVMGAQIGTEPGVSRLVMEYEQGISMARLRDLANRSPAVQKLLDGLPDQQDREALYSQALVDAGMDEEVLFSAEHDISPGTSNEIFRLMRDENSQIIGIEVVKIDSRLGEPDELGLFLD